MRPRAARSVGAVAAALSGATLVLVLVLAAPSSPALAAPCSLGTRAQQARAADAVFTGRVLDERTEAGTGVTLTRLLVEHPYKGRLTEELTVRSGGPGNPPRYRFEQGGLYTVFAVRGDGRTLSTSLCTGTTVGGIDPLLYGLRSAGSSTAGSSFMTFVVGALLVGGAVWALLRRRRHALGRVWTDEQAE